MAAELSKGKSPFYPGQPVPVELFVGRSAQIDHIMTRGVGQVAAGKPVAVFIQGEYGIGKSSIASFVQYAAEMKHELHAIYAPLGGAKTLTDLSEAVMLATVNSGAFNPRISERIRNWLAKYVGKQELWGGFTANVDALRKDAPALSSAFGMLDFLRQVPARLKEEGVKGVFLVLDEINGIAGNPDFAHFIKGLVDQNALSPAPVPLLLMLCGVEERRWEMIRNHQPIDRIFDVIEIEAMNSDEMEEFFTRAFDSVGMKVEKGAMEVLTHYAAGFPKIVHLVGDAAFWRDQDGIIDTADALDALFLAADEVGKKYMDQQVYNALRSEDYRSILRKIAKTAPDDMSFLKSSVEKELSDPEKKKFNNFLQRMKRLKVLKSGDVAGQYVFTMRMVRLYLWLETSRDKEHSKA